MKFPDDFVETGGLWAPRATGGTLNYSDGAEAEAYLRNVLTEAEELGSRSTELRDAIRDWPSRYHLSPERSNLLRCLDLDPASQVLEIGAGCGAITRYLGEATAGVLAVEGSRARAELCRLRCREQAHVQVVAADAFSLNLHTHFDVVTLIGVLEYAGVYCSEAEDPWQELLQIAAKRLRPGGQLIVAIENQLGLKYFTGCGEDHGLPRFSGIEGYPERNGVRTFGRRVLSERLQRCGLVATDLILPFPDYKIPNSFVNAAHCDAEAARKFGLADWCRRPFTDYARPRDYLFDDHLALAEIADNGLLSELSNSFLMVGTKGGRQEDSPVGTPSWVAQRFNSLRHPAYQCATTLNLRQGVARVHKRYLEPLAAEQHSNSRLEHVIDLPESYVTEAQTMSMEMLRAWRRRKGSEEAFAELLSQWLGFFQPEHGAEGSLNLLRGEFVDCVPDNLVRAPGGPWQYIDREWRTTEPVLLDWIFYRGLAGLWEHHSLAIAGAEARTPGARRRFIGRAFELLGSPLSGQDWNSIEKRERELQQIVREGRCDSPDSGVVQSGAPPARWPLPGRVAMVLGTDVRLD